MFHNNELFQNCTKGRLLKVHMYTSVTKTFLEVFNRLRINHKFHYFYSKLIYNVRYL